MPAGRGALIRAGILYGILTWGVYAFIEFALYSLVPFATKPETIFSPWYWRVSAQLALIYLGIGVAAGTIAGAALPWVAGARRQESPGFPQLLQAASTLIFALVFCLWLLSGSLHYSGAGASLALGAGLIAACILVMRSDAWLDRLAFLTGPWTACLLLVASPWAAGVLLSGRSKFGKTLAVLALLAAIIVTSLAAKTLQRRLSSRLAASGVAAQYAVLLLAAALSITSGFFFDGSSMTAARAQGPPGVVSTRPNVIFLVMDTVRADHLPLYGYGRDTTPHLRELAQDAVLYTRAMAAADMTLSSHASMFTGLYPSWHGAHFAPPEAPEGRPLSPNFKTLAEILSEAGYSTRAIVANTAFLQPAYGINQGFQGYDWRVPCSTAT
jgi:Sulfatase